MKPKQIAGYALLGIGGYFLFKFFTSERYQNIEQGLFGTTTTPEIMNANPKTLKTDYAEILQKEQSDLNPNYQLLRDISPSGQVTTYRVKASDLSAKEKAAIAGNRFSISDDTLSTSYTQIGASIKKTLKTYSGQIKETLSASIPPVASYNALRKAATSIDKGLNIQPSTLTPNKKLQTTTTGGTTTTYKGTTAQIVTGKALDKIKGVASSVAAKAKSLITSKSSTSKKK